MGGAERGAGAGTEAEADADTEADNEADGGLVGAPLDVGDSVGTLLVAAEVGWLGPVCSLGVGPPPDGEAEPLGPDVPLPEGEGEGVDVGAGVVGAGSFGDHGVSETPAAWAIPRVAASTATLAATATATVWPSLRPTGAGSGSELAARSANRRVSSGSSRRRPVSARRARATSRRDR